MQPLLVLVVAVVLLPAAPSDGALSSPTSGQRLDFIFSCYPDTPGTWACAILGQVFDRTLVFFRWDFNGDGIYDFGWVTGIGVWIGRAQMGSWRSCLQGWDGVSTKDGLPSGPVVCHSLALGGTLLVSPFRWNATSAGRASASWVPPAGFQISGRPESAALSAEGSADSVAAIPLRCWVIADEPRLCQFRLDRSSMTSAFGPGIHKVFLTGRWGDGQFFSLPTEIAILP